MNWIYVLAGGVRCIELVDVSWEEEFSTVLKEGAIQYDGARLQPYDESFSVFLVSQAFLTHPNTMASKWFIESTICDVCKELVPGELAESIPCLLLSPSCARCARCAPRAN